jgi:glycosyltransferase involved in cell wall biosynthesis
MPVYNGARFISLAIDSLLSQTYTDFELIICDNASTDATYKICQAYAARDPRIRLFRNERNMGATYNYRRVFQLSRGVYFRYAAHDDVLAPTNIERCVEILKREPEIVLCYPGMQRIDERGRIIDTFINSLPLREADPVSRWKRFHQLCHDGSMCDPIFGLFRSSVLRQTAGLGNFISHDMILLGEIALRGQIYEIPEILFFERWHPGTSVNANPTLDDRAAWFDPKNRGKLLNYLPQWVWLTRHLHTIARVPLNPLQKIACAAVMLPWMWRNKRGLVLSIAAVTALLLRQPRIALALRYH